MQIVINTIITNAVAETNGTWSDIYHSAIAQAKAYSIQIDASEIEDAVVCLLDTGYLDWHPKSLSFSRKLT